MFCDCDLLWLGDISELLKYKDDQIGKIDYVWNWLVGWYKMTFSKSYTFYRKWSLAQKL